MTLAAVAAAKTLFAAAVALIVALGQAGPFVGLPLVGAGPAATSETLFLDTHDPTNAGEVATTAMVLASGADYRITVEGTSSIFSPSAWSGFSLCDAAFPPESGVRFPSPGGARDGPAGMDPQFFFSSLVVGGTCIGGLPQPSYGPNLFQVCLDGTCGPGAWAHPSGGAGAYREDHTYTYDLVGQGHPLRARQKDAPYADNYGRFKITVEALGPTFPCAFHVDQGATRHVVDPYEKAQSVVAFYGYASASSHTGFEEPFASVMFLYYDTNSENLYFVFHFNIDEGGSTDAFTDLTLSGIPAGAAVVLSDDPFHGVVEFTLSRVPQGDFHYLLNTDGGVLGPLPLAGWSMTADFVHFGPQPMTEQKWVNGDTARLPLSLSGIITISSVCNRAPTAHAGGPYAGFEGSPIAFNATASSDPDGDALTYSWDFEDDGTFDLTTASPTASHTYPDDFSGQARLRVSDGQEGDEATVAVTVANVAPEVALGSATAPNSEGAGTAFRFSVFDPGADLVEVRVDWGDGGPPEPVGTFFRPNTAITMLHVYGDDGLFPLSVYAEDDDGGVGQLAGVLAAVDNEPPSIVALSGPADADEGSPVAVTLQASDPGSDDLTLTVDFGNGDVQTATRFNDGVGPDPDPSPGGTFPFLAEETFASAYADEGVFLVRGTVSDDDGGSAEASLALTVRNVAPTVAPFGPGVAVEGTGGSLTATATDPGADDLTFTWEVESHPPFVETFPSSGSPTTATSTVPFLFGDDGSYAVRLTVSDGDGGVAVFETTVEVENLAPTIESLEITRPGALGLRVAGEKWHDVTATFSQDGAVIAELRVVRTPGSPDDQAAWSPAFEDLPLGSSFSAVVTYTPEDDPVNGQPNGANPVWLLLGGPDDPVRVHHTFNVNHEDTWVWEVDLTPHVARLAVRFEATATDPGSDDLTFHWFFGDGSTASNTYFNDGVGPDPPKSPVGVFPFVAEDVVWHAYGGPGPFVVTLTVVDDDGGEVGSSVIIQT